MQQGCSLGSNLSFRLSSVAQTENGNGNGQGYDGKIIIVHNQVPGFTCEGLSRPKSILVQKLDHKWYLTVNETQKCEIIKDQEVQNVTYDDTTQTAQYQNSNFVAPKQLNVDATEDPNLADVDAIDGVCQNANRKCSLRAAFQESLILSAQADLSINIPASTYNLTSQINWALPNSNHVVSVLGAGTANTILNGGLTNRLFDISVSPNTHILFKDLTMRDGFLPLNFGSQGGAVHILGGGAATFDHVDFLNNEGGDEGGAIWSASISLSLLNCHFDANKTSRASALGGLALYSLFGSADIKNSVFTNHASTSVYGVMHIRSDFKMSGSTISNNVGHGMAFDSYLCSLGCLVENNTITNNTGAGIYYFSNSGSESITFRNNTIVDNGTSDINATGRNFRFYNVGSVATNMNFYNNIIFNNSGTGSNCFHMGGPFNFNSNKNIMSDNSCSSFTGTILADPLLSPLANNGGPTQTMLPQAGSPAIGQGDSTQCPSVDQRGNSRPVGFCDIGSVQSP